MQRTDLVPTFMPLIKTMWSSLNIVVNVLGMMIVSVKAVRYGGCAHMVDAFYASLVYLRGKCSDEFFSTVFVMKV